MVAAAAMACQPQLVIELTRNRASLGNPPAFVKFQIGERPNPTDVREFGPFDTDAIPDEQFAPVLPGTEFFIDVIGCGDGDPATCDEPSEFNARGCSGYIALAKDETTIVPIELQNAVDGDLICPPAS